jgi:protein-disulfide isomerase
MSLLKVPVSLNDHIQGDENALVTLVEYGDYECPYCGRAYPVVKAVQKHFGPQLMFVFRNFPLTQIHPLAEPAAEAAEFAGSRGRFWEMHDGIYENQERLSLPLLRTCRTVGFTPGRCAGCKCGSRILAENPQGPSRRCV